MDLQPNPSQAQQNKLSYSDVSRYSRNQILKKDAYSGQQFGQTKKNPQKMTYHLSTSNDQNRKARSQIDQKEMENVLFQDSLAESQVQSSGNQSQYSQMLKSNQNGGYYEELQKIKKFKGKNEGYFQAVIVQEIKSAQNIPQGKKVEIIELYRALCVFSSTNVLFYKRLIKHEKAFPLWHSDESKNIYPEPEEKLPKLKELMKAHLGVGAGIQNIRTFYNSKDLVKDQYSTLLHALLRVVFSKVRDFIILKYPKLDWLLITARGGTARFNYSNAVSISLLHANKQFSPSMNACYEKITKVVYYFDGIQEISLGEVQALFQLLRERNQQHIVPIAGLNEQTNRKKSQARKFTSLGTGYIPYVPYAEPQCDVDFQVFKPTGQQMFERCENYLTRNWTLKFQKYVMALFMKHQNFLDIKQIINSQYHEYLGKQLDLEQLRGKFDNTMKKLVIYLQLELYYIIRRTNVYKVSNYKVDYAIKKFLTLNKNQKRAIFTSENSRHCRMFLIDYYLNNFQRRSKSYKMSCINYRLSYLDMTIESIMMFLQSKLGECGILPQSQLQKQDTCPLKLIPNAYFSIIKSILKQIMLYKAIKQNDLNQKLIKKANSRRSLYNVTQVQKLFEQLKPDDLMQIQTMYLIRRNKSLIVKRNPRKFKDFKITKTLQEGLVEEYYEELVEIVGRRGRNENDEEEQKDLGREKFQNGDGIDVEDQELLQIDRSSKGNKSLSQTDRKSRQKPTQKSKQNKQGSSQPNGSHSSKDPKGNRTANQPNRQQEALNKQKAQFMKALKESEFIKTQMLIMRLNNQRDFFKKYYK